MLAKNLRDGIKFLKLHAKKRTAPHYLKEYRVANWHRPRMSFSDKFTHIFCHSNIKNQSGRRLKLSMRKHKGDPRLVVAYLLINKISVSNGLHIRLR